MHALTYNLGNFLRTVALPGAVRHWPQMTLIDRFVKSGGKVLRHGRYFTFRMVEGAIPRRLFTGILRHIDRLRPRPCPA